MTLAHENRTPDKPAMGWETRLVESLPCELQGSLPTVDDIEAELARSSMETEE